MSHQRQAIREALQAMLVAADTAAADRVYINRTNPLSQRPSSEDGSAQEELPAILIYTRNEAAEIFNVSPREYRRTVEVIIELVMAITETTGAIDNALDDFAEAVEAVILRDDTVTNTASDFRLVASSMAIVDEGEVPIGAVQLVCEAEYVEYHPKADLQDDEDDLRTVNTEYQVAG